MHDIFDENDDISDKITTTTTTTATTIYLYPKRTGIITIYI